ncbi:DUF3180 domain-containing protein [Bifidobacterium simiarum]|uniref:DUF3180 domain-containing protein n=1 Tax=Bifidobacterium simiarum TaxID=2045441 RepID=A0A2M9HCZ8_9BIFI|nr:DUF3180 domain-containing protein [Bifidobacterium simiarum]PJM74689.1 hypothetical protein CSQ87_09155 [Bifidobacterium simiarum]
MKARRTPWWYYVIAMILGLFAGAMLVKLTEHSAYTLVGAPWLVSGLLVILGLIVLCLAWQVRRYAKGDLKELDMNRAVQTLVLSKALGVAGAALAGWYGGQLLVSLTHVDAEFYGDAALECGVATVICLIDMIIGIVGEYWCQLPPKDGPESPKAKAEQRQRQLAAAGAAASGAANATDERTASRTPRR